MLTITILKSMRLSLSFVININSINDFYPILILYNFFFLFVFIFIEPYLVWLFFKFCVFVFTIFTISKIILYTDELNVRIPSFLGFSLFVSNSTDRLNGILCFKDIEFNISTIPEVFNTTCRMFGQYIIYYNERLSGVSYPSDYNNYAENDLCEVEVYGKDKFIGYMVRISLSVYQI